LNIGTSGFATRHSASFSVVLAGRMIFSSTAPAATWLAAGFLGRSATFAGRPGIENPVGLSKFLRSSLSKKILVGFFDNPPACAMFPSASRASGR
jgi:hypothetical protein